MRFFTGLVAALAIVLTAFEWRGRARAQVEQELFLREDRWVVEVLPAVYVRPPEAAPLVHTAARPAPGGLVMPVAEPVEPTGDAPPGADAGPVVAASTALDTGQVTPMRPFVPVKETMPCHRECATLPDGLREVCTTERLHAYVARHLELPRDIRGALRTTVTFTVEADGRVGRVVCAPKVPADVEEALTRLLRRMPALEPGRQGEVPVPVHYQMAISLSTR
ncbi:MAG: hypothetical protein JNM31_06745 [Flavobacteriales bacterium]|nr:hypothetical protein [Flavobacteriales bacterium]